MRLLSQIHYGYEVGTLKIRANNVICLKKNLNASRPSEHPKQLSQLLVALNTKIIPGNKEQKIKEQRKRKLTITTQ